MRTLQTNQSKSAKLSGKELDLEIKRILNDLFFDYLTSDDVNLFLNEFMESIIPSESFSSLEESDRHTFVFLYTKLRDVTKLMERKEVLNIVLRKGRLA
ncbi:hypothetical protein KO02_12205 [Sphingobacterium sp. ML3W]|uniref:hypothetical protein n=1 Tax=Sphingobacterium sp. ML3W TaxID=1538644 RepID=UPI0004F8B97A|nr:hypothetical protein [Sphingobacterium sp. ML3W]AIM37368.1 hypothetical protein KO02_12205 [Sphingobacterium sp. ML3W]